MATRNFVPRSGSEGQLGTVAKPWGKVVADTLMGSISGSATSTGSFGSLSIVGNITAGNITAGTLSLSNITASGDISASGTIFASKFESAGDSGEVISFNDNLNITGDITASNNISASGTIFASKFESAGASGETISFNDNLNITGDITASGNISASGDIRSDGRIFEKGTSVIDHATAMAIVFGG